MREKFGLARRSVRCKRGSMKFPLPLRTVPALTALLLSATPLPAADLFSEGFNDEASAKVLSNSGTGMIIQYVDYSLMTVGETAHHIPEAPRHIEGTLPTRGVLLRVNYPASPAVVQRIVNLAAADSSGLQRLVLTDNYRLKFDFYLRLSPAVTLAGGVPTNTGTTEQMLWGVGYNAITPMGRGTIGTRGSGVWGWLSTEGGYSAANGSDASICTDTAVVMGRNMDLLGLDTATYFSPAFGADASPVPNAPANQWVEATITVRGGQVTVQYMAAGRVATKFYENIPGTVGGGAMVGYEDSASSASFAPDQQWMLLDNMVVEDLPPPTLVVSAGPPLATYPGSPVSTNYTLQNTRAAGNLTVSAVNFSGTNAADFSVMTPLPLVVAPGGSGLLEIAFHPAAPNGVKSTSFMIVSDDPEVPSYLVNNLRARRSVGSFFEVHYKLDELSGTALRDASGNVQTGKLEVREPASFGNPSLLGAGDTGFSMGLLPAQTGTTGSYITTPVVHTPTYSISFHMKPAATGAVRTLFERDYDFASQYEKICGLLLTPEGILRYRVRNTTLFDSAPVVTDGTACHVVLTHLDEDGFGNDTATRARLYLNGRLVAETPGFSTTGFDDYPLTPAVSALHIGSRTVAGFGYAGDFDDIQVYGAELTPEQVWELYQHPGVAASGKFEILSATLSGNPAAFTVTVPSSPNARYRLYRSVDLQTWEPAGDAVAGDAEGLITGLQDPGPVSGKPFYRVERE